MNNPKRVGLWTAEVLVRYVVVDDSSFTISFKHTYIYIYIITYICIITAALCYVCAELVG
jgi:hypothetical protein